MTRQSCGDASGHLDGLDGDEEEAALDEFTSEAEHDDDGGLGKQKPRRRGGAGELERQQQGQRDAAENAEGDSTTMQKIELAGEQQSGFMQRRIVLHLQRPEDWKLAGELEHSKDNA